MKCPFCHKDTIIVVNSRQAKHNSVWRRRKCLSCNETYTTTEVFSVDALFVVKRNLSRKRFVYEKLFTSILNAVIGGKIRDQGDDAAKAKRMCAVIIEKIIALNSKYIATKEIVRFAYEALAKEDSFYATRYAMYSDFRLRVIKKGK
jgi:transcriptional repressor NrdR